MADKDQVIQALRATLISVKGALTIKQCNREYHLFYIKTTQRLIRKRLCVGRRGLEPYKA